MFNTIALIPARGGSKGIPRKNIKLLGNKPLIAYSIEVALKIMQINEVYVSTDDAEIAKIASDYGALVPFLRPKELAQDNSPIIDCIDHFLGWFVSDKKFIPEFLILFLPTTPFRDVNLINEAIIKMNFNPNATSLRSVEEIPDNPHKWFKLEKDYLYPLLDNDFDLHYKPRQQIPKVYKPNGYIDILKIDTLLNYDSLYGKRILSFITPHTVDIDTIDDFKYAEYILKQGGKNE